MKREGRTDGTGTAGGATITQEKERREKKIREQKQAKGQEKELIITETREIKKTQPQQQRIKRERGF